LGRLLSEHQIDGETGSPYPTAEHKLAAERIVEYFSALPGLDAVILMGSSARGKAHVGSCVDILVLVQPDVLALRREELRTGWDRFYAEQEVFERLRQHGRFSHVDLDFVDGHFEPRPREWTSGPDEFEPEIGNTLVYAVPLWTGTDYFERLRAEWLPYYGEALRSERLAIVRRYCLNNLEHIPLYVDRGLYFQALNPDFSPGVVANRRRAPWIQGLRRRTPQAYPGRYVEDGRGSVTK
jgi:predicted nucleotidyltransferase